MIGVEHLLATLFFAVLFMVAYHSDRIGGLR